MNFEEPKVEFLHLSTNDVVFASYNAGGTTTCRESGGPTNCADGNSMLDPQN